VSTRGQRAAATSLSAAVGLDDIDDDSDFEVSSKSRVGARASVSGDRAKYCAFTILVTGMEQIIII